MRSLFDRPIFHVMSRKIGPFPIEMHMCISRSLLSKLYVPQWHTYWWTSNLASEQWGHQ